MGILIRLVMMLVLRFRWGPFIIAAIIVVLGLGVGLTSHQVVYQQADHISISHYLSGSDDNKAYIQTSDGSLYVLTETDFTPTLNSDTLQSRTATLVYDPQDTESVDVDSTNTSTHLDGTGSTIVKLISYGTDGSSKTFTTSEYTAHPQGLYSNKWGEGAAIMLGGIVVGGIFFLLRKHNQKKAGGRGSISITPASVMTGAAQQQASFQQQAAYPPDPYHQPTPYPQASFQPQAAFSPDPYQQQAPYPQAAFPNTFYPPEQQAPSPQTPYPQPAPGQQVAGSGKPDRYSTLPGALPSNPSWGVPTEYNPYNRRQQ